MTGTPAGTQQAPHPLWTESKAMLRLAAPFAVAQLGLMFMGVVDVMMVGRVSQEAMAAVALGHIYSFGLQIPFTGMLLVLDPLVAQAFGAEDPRAISFAIKRGILLSCILCLPLGLLLWNAVPLLEGLAALGVSQPPEIIPVAAGYARAVSPGYFAMFFFFVLRQSLQAMSIIRPVVVAVLLANVANVVFNYAFVWGNLGFPAWGPVGTGVASSCSRLLLLLATAWISRGTVLRYLRLETARVFQVAPLLRMVGLGLPIGIQLALEVWMFITVGLLMGNLGSLVLAGHQITMSLASSSFMIPLAVGMAAATRVGNAVGRRDVAGARRAALASLLLGGAIMLVSALLFVTMPRLLARAFTAERDLIEMAALLLPVAGFFQIFDGTQAVACGILRGLADTRVPAVINFVGYWLLALPTGIALARLTSLGARGPWWGMTLGLGIVSILLSVRVLHRLREAPVRVEEDPPR